MEDEESFGFAFNDNDFSDRVLRIEITISTSRIEVNRLHVCSAILAAKSPFFYKLFKNGMMETQSKDVTLKINSSEKPALLDLLQFMYSKSLSSTSSSDLLDVLIVADKFQVSSCMRYCIQLLLKMPMSLESAHSYLELPSITILVAEVVQPLIDAAKQYLYAHYKNFSNFLEEAMELSLCRLEFALGSEWLQVDSEDDVYEFILKWGRAHYPDLKERQEVLGRLTQFICFPNMSSSKLKEIQICPDFDHKEISKLVMEALFYKVDILYGKHIYTSKNQDSTGRSFSGCLYHDRLVKVAPLENPCPRRVIYYDLKKEECEKLYATKELYSQPFLINGRWLSLYVACNKNEKSLLEHFDLYVEMRKGSESCSLEFQLEAMKKSSMKFEKLHRGTGSSNLTDHHGMGRWDLFGISWTDFMSDESDYFIEGILSLRADLTIIDP